MIVPFEGRHLDDIAEIEELCFSCPWSKQGLEQSLKSQFSRFFVWLDGSRAVGYMGLYCVAGEGSVTNVAVHPDFRKRGIGKALVENAVAVGAREGLEYITLEVRQSNAKAYALYEKCGFQEVGVRKNFYSNPVENAIIMNYFFKEEKQN